MYIHSDKRREGVANALPNIEVSWFNSEDAGMALGVPETARTADLAGYYWQACFSGCLPDGEPHGPFETEEEAIADAQDCNDYLASLEEG